MSVEKREDAARNEAEETGPAGTTSPYVIVAFVYVTIGILMGAGWLAAAVPVPIP